MPIHIHLYWLIKTDRQVISCD